MHYLVGVSHLAKYGPNRPLIVSEMLPFLFHNGEENEKVIQNPHADLDHHQKLTTSRGSALPMPAKFSRRPFLHSSVILFTE